MKREWSDGRTKLAAEISLKGDASLLKLRKSILYHVNTHHHRVEYDFAVITSRACRDVPYILLHTSPKTALRGASPSTASCECNSILNLTKRK